MTAFKRPYHDLGAVSLRPLSTGSAWRLGAALAAMPPWSVIGYPAQRLSEWLEREEPSMAKFEVLAGAKLAGVIVIQDPFLHGPYLKLIAVLPEFQRQGVGQTVLRWMESEARQGDARQLWLCVSSFNMRARVFYERMGFETVALLDKLASDASDELFMRKRLSCGTAAR